MIEFRCQQCGATLRVPVGTEGKQAKCPQCSALMTIPTPNRPGDSFRPAPSPADFSAPPPREGAFNQTSAAAGPAPDPSNPFQAPQYAGAPFQNYGAAARGFRPTPIDFGRTFDTAWRIYKANFGLLIGAALIAGAVWVIGVMVGAAVEISLNGFDPDRPTTATAALVNFIVNVASGVAQTFLQLGLIRMSLNLARQEPASIADLFGQGDKLVSAIVANILFGIAATIGFILLIIPGVWAMLAFSLIWFMIVDQGAGIVDSFKMSHAAMRGNKLTLLGLWLVLGGVSMIVLLLTCGLGMLVVWPFAAVLLTVVYLGATGQLSGSSEQPAPYTTP